MRPRRSVRNKPHVNVGTIGHVDLGTQSVLVTLSW
jgi:translation elongation factor EF-Tu-like GTPase